MCAYLLVMGLIIVKKAFKKKSQQLSSNTSNIGKLAFFGGFVDSAGGGGWGPIVTTNLFEKGKTLVQQLARLILQNFFNAFYCWVFHNFCYRKSMDKCRRTSS